jgi:hypothetical protein
MDDGATHHGNADVAGDNHLFFLCRSASPTAHEITITASTRTTTAKMGRDM